MKKVSFVLAVLMVGALAFGEGFTFGVGAYSMPNAGFRVYNRSADPSKQGDCYYVEAKANYNHIKANMLMSAHRLEADAVAGFGGEGWEVAYKMGGELDGNEGFTYRQFGIGVTASLSKGNGYIHATMAVDALYTWAEAKTLHYTWAYPKNVVTLGFDASVTLFGILTVGGKITSWQYPEKLTSYNAFSITNLFYASARVQVADFMAITVRSQHLCQHPENAWELLKGAELFNRWYDMSTVGVEFTI